MSRSLRIQDIENVTALSALFSSSTINELANQTLPTRFKSLLFESNLISYTDSNMPVRDVFDLAFNLLIKRDLRSEFVYKAALFEKIVLGKNSLNTATAITELRVNKSKLDVAIFNGSSVAYEIKSERDNLSKLEKQISDYRQAFPQVAVVVGENHLYHILATIPENVGIYILNRKFQLSEIRQPRVDKTHLNADAICSMLRLSEGKRILADLGGNVPDLPNTLIHDAVFSQLKNCEVSELQSSVLRILKLSRGLKSKSGLVDSLPRSLKSLVTSTKFSKSQLHRLQSNLNAPISNIVNID